MPMIEKIALKLRRIITKPEERGEYSSGFLPYLVRTKVKELVSTEPAGRLLEIGSGEGLFLAEVSMSCPSMRLAGLEPWDEMVSKSRERILSKGLHNVEIVKGVSQKIPFEEGTFDHVVCVNLLNNLATDKDVAETLSEMIRVCKKGGSIYFDFRNKLNPVTYVVYKLAPLHDPNIKVPLRMQTLRSMEKILKKIGVEKVKFFGIGIRLGRFSTAIVIQAEKSR